MAVVVCVVVLITRFTVLSLMTDVADGLLLRNEVVQNVPVEVSVPVALFQSQVASEPVTLLLIFQALAGL